MRTPLVFLLLLFAAAIRGQILNGDFEKWTVSDHPDGWNLKSVPFLQGPRWSGHNSNICIRMELDPSPAWSGQWVILENSDVYHRGNRVAPLSRAIVFWYINDGDTNIAPIF